MNHNFFRKRLKSDSDDDISYKFTSRDPSNPPFNPAFTVFQFPSSSFCSPTFLNNNPMDTPEGLRLRLMTLLSLYDLLPYSISHPPNGTAPMTLDEAIGPDAVRRCLEAMSRQSQSLPTELANILVRLCQTIERYFICVDVQCRGAIRGTHHPVIHDRHTTRVSRHRTLKATTMAALTNRVAD